VPSWRPPYPKMASPIFELRASGLRLRQGALGRPAENDVHGFLVTAERALFRSQSWRKISRAIDRGFDRPLRFREPDQPMRSFRRRIVPRVQQPASAPCVTGICRLTARRTTEREHAGGHLKRPRNCALTRRRECRSRAGQPRFCKPANRISLLTAANAGLGQWVAQPRLPRNGRCPRGALRLLALVLGFVPVSSP